MAAAMNEARLRTWMESLGPRLIGLSAGICRDRHQAEEVVQEAFVRLWKSPPEGGDVVVPAWMRKVVTNLSINALQRIKRPGALPEFSTDRSMQSGDRSDGGAEQKEQVERLSAAMDRLDDGKRTILMLRAQEQMSYEDIAAHLDVPVGTVMSRLNRARLALMDEMKKDVKQPEEEPMVYDFRRYKQA